MQNIADIKNLESFQAFLQTNPSKEDLKTLKGHMDAYINEKYEKIDPEEYELEYEDDTGISYAEASSDEFDQWLIHQVILGDELSAIYTTIQSLLKAKDFSKALSQENKTNSSQTPQELKNAVQNFEVLKALALLQSGTIKNIGKDILTTYYNAIDTLVDRVVVDSNNGNGSGEGIHTEFSEFIDVDYNASGFKDYNGDVRKELKKSSLDELRKILESIIKGKSIESALQESVFYDKKGKFKPKYPNLCYIPFTPFELKILVELDSVSLEQIDLSFIKSLSSLFANYSMAGLIHFRTNRKDFSGIESWDTSKIKEMNNLFAGLKDFNANLSKWKVTSVKDFVSMFRGCESFNSDLSKWKPKKAENINSMFEGCKSFSSDLNAWDLPSELIERSKCIFTDCPLQNNPPLWYKAVFDMDNPSYELLCKLVQARDYKQAKIILEKIAPLQNEQYENISKLCFYVPSGTVSNAMPDEEFFSAFVESAKSQGFHVPISNKVMQTCLRYNRLEYAKFLATLGYKVKIDRQNSFGVSVALRSGLSEEIKEILEFTLDHLDNTINIEFFSYLDLEDSYVRGRFNNFNEESLDFFFQGLLKRYPKEMCDKKLLSFFVNLDLIYLLFKHGVEVDLKDVAYNPKIIGGHYLSPSSYYYEPKGKLSRFLQLLGHNLSVRADTIVEYAAVKAPALLIFLSRFKDKLNLNDEEYPMQDILKEFASHNVDVEKLGTYENENLYEILEKSPHKEEVLALFKK